MVAWIKKVANAVRNGMSFWGMVGQLTISIVGGLTTAGLLGFFSSIPILFRADTILSGLGQAVEAAREWQIALVGVFGVSTVLIAANQIVRAIRRRDEEIREHDRQREAERLEHERRALAAALIGEIGGIVRTACSRHRVLAENDTQQLNGIPRFPNFFVFQSVAANLGILGPSLAENVAAVYAMTENFHAVTTGQVLPDACGPNGNATTYVASLAHRAFSTITKLAPVAGFSESHIANLRSGSKIDHVPLHGES